MIAAVSDPWTRPEPVPPPEPMLQHVRDVWTLQGIMSIATAKIYRNVFGLELRIELAGELMESRLSRFGEEPLLLIAEQAKAELLKQGWFAQPNAT
jgi:hypothetical protein